ARQSCARRLQRREGWGLSRSVVWRRYRAPRRERLAARLLVARAVIHAGVERALAGEGGGLGDVALDLSAVAHHEVLRGHLEALDEGAAQLLVLGEAKLHSDAVREVRDLAAGGEHAFDLVELLLSREVLAHVLSHAARTHGAGVGE